MSVALWAKSVEKQVNISFMINSLSFISYLRLLTFLLNNVHCSSHVVHFCLLTAAEHD